MLFFFERQLQFAEVDDRFENKVRGRQSKAGEKRES